MIDKYIKCTDLQILGILEDTHDCLCFPEDAEDERQLRQDIEDLHEIIDLRKRLGLWDYSAEVENYAFTNEIAEILYERGLINCYNNV